MRMLRIGLKTKTTKSTGSETDSIERSEGFTLVEVMVVVTLLVVFLGFGVLSGGTIKDQLAFFRNQQVVIAQIYKARALAVATLNKESVCGYAVTFSNGFVNIHALNKPNPDFDCIGGFNWGLMQSPMGAYARELEGDASVSGGRVAFVAPIPTVQLESGPPSAVAVRVNDVCGSVLISQFGQVTTSASCN